MEVVAKLRYYRQSPRKVRLITDLIKGLNTSEALSELQFANKTAARQVIKLIQSAVANATHNFSLDANNLFIKNITVDSGPTLKRWRARAFGRASMIRKHMSHVTITLDEKVHGQRKRLEAEREPKPSTFSAGDVATKPSENEESPHITQERVESHDLKPSIQKKSMGFMPKIFRRKAG